MNPTTAFWTQWRHDLLNAQPLYWTLQAMAVLGLCATTAMLWLPGDVAGVTGTSATTRLLRVLVDSLLLFGGAHVALRTVLRRWFVGQQAGLGPWALLVGGVALLALLVMALSYLASAHLIGDGMNFNTIHFSSEQGVMDFNLSGMPVYLMGVFNMFVTYLLWVLLYLAFKAFQSRRQLQAQLREARVRQLTHQLNPHFLFNTFNTIRGMIFEDRERAAELVTQLSELFRFHLSHELRTEQTLAEEWELARRYLDVESVRLESRLRLEVDIDPACLERTLPSLTLLTLVENAIKHGIAPNAGGGVLRVGARCVDKGWQLEVGNSVGPGAATVSSGTGLANLRERLALTLGHRATLEVGHDEDWFTLRLEMPA